MDDHVDDHPLAELFPLMSDAEIRDMAEDIKANGQQHLIVLYEGKILDGRNRARACNIAKVEPKYTTFKGSNPLAFVLSRNLHRRHLTTSQRGIVAAKIATMRQGERTDKEPSAKSPKVDQESAAKALGVSVKTVGRAKQVIEQSPKKAEQVAAGEKTLGAAEREIKEESKPKEKPSDKLPKDDRGVTLPANKVALWNRRGELAELAEMVSKVRVAIGKAQDKDDPLFSHINHSSTIAALDQAYAAISGSKPYCVCPMCQGAGCRACRKTGLLGKFQFKTFVPKELKGKDA